MYIKKYGIRVGPAIDILGQGQTEWVSTRIFIFFFLCVCVCSIAILLTTLLQFQC